MHSGVTLQITCLMKVRSRRRTRRTEFSRRVLAILEFSEERESAINKAEKAVTGRQETMPFSLSEAQETTAKRVRNDCYDQTNSLIYKPTNMREILGEYLNSYLYDSL